jgi:hypothetical protein
VQYNLDQDFEVQAIVKPEANNELWQSTVEIEGIQLQYHTHTFINT